MVKDHAGWKGPPVGSFIWPPALPPRDGGQRHRGAASLTASHPGLTLPWRSNSHGPPPLAAPSSAATSTPGPAPSAVDVRYQGSLATPCSSRGPAMSAARPSALSPQPPSSTGSRWCAPPGHHGGGHRRGGTSRKPTPPVAPLPASPRAAAPLPPPPAIPALSPPSARPSRRPAPDVPPGAAPPRSLPRVPPSDTQEKWHGGCARSPPPPPTGSVGGGMRPTR